MVSEHYGGYKAPQKGKNMSREFYDRVEYACNRYEGLRERYPDLPYYKRLDMVMDLINASRNEKADLAKLCAFPDDDFIHDMCGIDENMDRNNLSATYGRLLNCFLPRCSG